MARLEMLLCSCICSHPGTPTPSHASALRKVCLARLEMRLWPRMPSHPGTPTPSPWRSSSHARCAVGPPGNASREWRVPHFQARQPPALALSSPRRYAVGPSGCLSWPHIQAPQPLVVALGRYAFGQPGNAPATTISAHIQARQPPALALSSPRSYAFGLPGNTPTAPGSAHMQARQPCDIVALVRCAFVPLSRLEMPAAADIQARQPSAPYRLWTRRYSRAIGPPGRDSTVLRPGTPTLSPALSQP